MSRVNTKKIVLAGLFIALVFLCTYFTRIPGPIPPGYINFGDAVIKVAAVLFGKSFGFFAGSIGSAIADLASPGGIIYAPITFIVKGVEGYIIGAIASSSAESGRKREVLRIVSVIAGAIVMIAGYFLAEATVLKVFDSSFGYVAAVTNLPFNVIQGGVSSIVGYLLVTVLERAGVKKALI